MLPKGNHSNLGEEVFFRNRSSWRNRKESRKFRSLPKGSYNVRTKFVKCRKTSQNGPERKWSRARKSSVPSVSSKVVPSEKIVRLFESELENRPSLRNSRIPVLFSSVHHARNSPVMFPRIALVRCANCKSSKECVQKQSAHVGKTK